MKYLFLILLITADLYAQDFKNGKFVNNKGTKEETIVYQKDSVEWFLVTVADSGEKTKLPITNRSKFQLSKDFSCQVAYETNPIGDEMFKKENVRSKVVYCKFSTGKKYDFHSMCFLNKKKSVPFEGFGKLGKAGSMYLECKI